MFKCGAGDAISASSYLDVMNTYNIELDKREIEKINKAKSYNLFTLFSKPLLKKYSIKTLKQDFTFFKGKLST